MISPLLLLGDFMTIREQVLDGIKAAMKNKEQVKLDTLRFLQSAIKNREIELRPNPISDEDILNVVKKLAKQRKESIEQYINGGRVDLADKEQAELIILEQFLPKALSDEETQNLVQQVIQELGAKTPKDMGLVIKTVIARSGGSADNKKVSELAKAQLQG